MERQLIWAYSISKCYTNNYTYHMKTSDSLMLGTNSTWANSEWLVDSKRGLEKWNGKEKIALVYN